MEAHVGYWRTPGNRWDRHFHACGETAGFLVYGRDPFLASNNGTGTLCVDTHSKSNIKSSALVEKNISDDVPQELFHICVRVTHFPEMETHFSKSMIVIQEFYTAAWLETVTE